MFTSNKLIETNFKVYINASFSVTILDFQLEKKSSLEIVLQPPAVGGGAPLDALPAGLVLEDRPGAPRHPHVVPGPGAREGGARDHGAVLQPHREALVRTVLI